MPGPLEAAAAQAGSDNSEMKRDDVTASNTTSPEAEPEEAEEEASVMYDGLKKKSFALWAITAPLSITGLMSAIEGRIITSALPTINSCLGGSANLYLHKFASL
ncbi:hypothetical protein MAPG_04791 [Magnaporthiopsis poae ATCC 64411]|uniref:Uncharacterized protein n=1 Tax=Magnaporthiopsis poae (strain ATCC 64411 / 73-15) TaxID=644358 RepID=A0A0C4DXN7_MAGP6|nr:hypothetical protein MAPG_04791 [Magnaporthiopsis poae ATCC 64411]